MVNTNSLVILTFTLAVVVIGGIALIRNTDTELNINLGKNLGTLKITGNRSSPNIEKTKLNCESSQENSQASDCTNH